MIFDDIFEESGVYTFPSRVVLPPRAFELLSKEILEPSAPSERLIALFKKYKARFKAP